MDAGGLVEAPQVWVREAVGVDGGLLLDLGCWGVEVRAEG